MDLELKMKEKKIVQDILDKRKIELEQHIQQLTIYEYDRQWLVDKIECIKADIMTIRIQLLYLDQDIYKIGMTLVGQNNTPEIIEQYNEYQNQLIFQFHQIRHQCINKHNQL